MSFIKQGEHIEINKVENTDSCIPAVSAEVLENFKKIATNLKRIAPRAEDFLYFSAVMMHAAESSAINDDGTPKLNVKGEEVKVGWDKKGNTWRWETNDNMIKPYKNCFIPGTQILMEDGTSKNIEDIEIGDMVITHKGNTKKVLKKFITPHSGNMIEIHVRNGRKIVCTDNHPFYKLNVSIDYDTDVSPKKLLKVKSSNKKYEFVKSSDLKKYDLLLSPVLPEISGSELTESQARLLGLFAAEGSYSKKYNKYQGVRFTFNSNEFKTLADDVKRLAQESFNKCSVNIHQEHGNTCCVYITGYGVADFFRNHVGEYSQYKTLSKDLVFGNENIKKQFIIGWLEGDGHVSKNHNQVIGITTSKYMASQIRIMLNSCHINHSLRHIISDGKEKLINSNYSSFICADNYRIEIPSTSAKALISLSKKLHFTCSHKDKPQNAYYENNVMYSITDINNTAYEGNVYNIEVEDDHSYIANDIAVHNCNGDIFPEEELIKAYKKWVHKPLCIDHKSSSVDHTRGFIVDTYYDYTLKRVIALCALDKANYPDLARKVSTGMQTNVSMGTAVGKAICSDCATVARAESDFCEHMKRKTCYGEINIDLNPIELSIVVTGADPKANIKHIIAAANTLNSYVENKSKEFSKLSDLSALEQFKSDIDAAFEKLQDIKKSEKDTNDLAFNQSSGSVSMDETEMPSTDSNLAPPHARLASESKKSSIEELRVVTASIETKLDHIKQNLDRLSKNTHEENMSSKELNKKSYYQGTEDPTPGQVKYPIDKGHMAFEDDKHMHGQSPFPDMGPVDGMHPGVESSNMSELERKKMLARAESEERAIRRQAIVNLAKQALEDKKAYFQNGDEKNPGSPTPGQVKYPVDKGHMAFEDDKHMHGQKPFPGVGPVDGLHPSPDSADTSDELKRKEMLRRANTLRGTFVRASKVDGTKDLDNSTWEIRLGEKLLLSTSVKDLSGGRSEMMYDSINTPEFGQRLLEKVKTYGVDKVRSLVKSGQTPPAAPDMGAPPADVGASEPVAPQAGNPVEMPEDTGKNGDPKASALELAEKVRDIGSDLVEAVRALTGEQSEMGADMGVKNMGATASDSSLAHMNVLRGEINESLTHAMKEVIAELNDHKQELEMIAGMYDSGAVHPANEDFVSSIVEDAENEAKIAVADGFRLMTAFVKYARGTKAIVKHAEIEAELEALAEGDDTMNTDGDLMSLIQDTDSDLDSVKDMMSDDDNNHEERSHDLTGGSESLDELDRLGDTDLDLGDEEQDLGNQERDLGDEERELGGYDNSDDEPPSDDDDMYDSNDLMAKPEELKDLTVKPGTNVQVTAGFNSRASRHVLRAKLAADALGKQDDGQVQDMSKQKFSDMLDEADGLTNGQIKLDTKPSNNLGYVETHPEINKAMMDLAKAPVKVRKEAEVIHKLISEGRLDPADLDDLVAEGLDKDAVSYYKKYYSQVDGGGEFASELVKEHVKAEMEEELNKYRVKLARAYEVAYDMVDRGLCHNDKIAISSQVDEIMKFNDDSFDTLKRVVAKHAPGMRKEAGRMPQIGVFGSVEENNTALAAEDDWSLLSAALSKTSKRMF